MEFKYVQQKINDLESNRSFLTDNGESTLAELKELLKQRNEMLDMLKKVFLEKLNGTNNISYEELEQLIEEATKID